MLHSISHCTLMEKIVSIYDECNIQTFPVDYNLVITHYGFRIFSYSELKEINRRIYDLAITYSKDSFTFADIIAYNEKPSKQRVLFSLMHEFGHNILEHKENTLENEDEADEFASHFLAPRILIHKFGYRTCDEIHDAFGISYAASNRALADYHNWLNNICHTARKPSTPEMELVQLFFPKIIEKPINCISDKHSPKKRKRNSKIKKELEEKIAFIQELYIQRGEEYLFALAEKQKLYGNDL